MKIGKVIQWFKDRLGKTNDSSGLMQSMVEQWYDPRVDFERATKVDDPTMVVCPVCQQKVGHLQECPEVGEWSAVEFSALVNKLTHELAEYEAERMLAWYRRSMGKVKPS